MAAPDLEFFFDPACPFCWITSKWARLVGEETGIEIRWSYISLVTLNEPYDDPDAPMARGHMMGRRAHRVIDAAAREHGEDAIGPLYEAIGNRTWEAEGPGGGWDDVMAQLAEVDLAGALAAVGLPTELAAAADDDQHDHVFEQHTKEALSRAGEDVGTPIVTFDPDGDQPASFFGPVISEVPTPEDSVALYRALQTAASIRTFAELKRSNREHPQLPLLAGLG